MDKAKLDRLRELAQAATPGPWYADGRHVQLQPPRKGPGGAVCPTSVASAIEPPNAPYLAEADPTTVLELLDRIAELEAGVGRVRSLVAERNQEWEACDKFVHLDDVDAALAGRDVDADACRHSLVGDGGSLWCIHCGARRE